MILCTSSAFLRGWWPTKAGDPSSVGRSSVSKMSFTPTGTPCSAPARPPGPRPASRASASASARASSIAAQALTLDSVERIRARRDSQYARAVSVPSASAWTASSKPSGTAGFAASLLSMPSPALAAPLRPGFGIEEVRRAPARKGGREVLHRDEVHLHAGGARRAADVRNESGVVRLEEPGIELRLALEHVQARREDAPFLERPDERRVVDDPAARGVDDHRGRLHLRERRGADEMVDLRRVGHVEADEIGFPEELVHARVLRPQGLFHRFRRAFAVVIQDAHGKTLRPAGHRLADASHADDSQRGVMHVLAEQAVVSPPLYPVS